MLQVADLDANCQADFELGWKVSSPSSSFLFFTHFWACFIVPLRNCWQRPRFIHKSLLQAQEQPYDYSSWSVSRRSLTGFWDGVFSLPESMTYRRKLEGDNGCCRKEFETRAVGRDVAMFCCSSTLVCSCVFASTLHRNRTPFKSMIPVRCANEQDTSSSG